MAGVKCQWITPKALACLNRVPSFITMIPVQSIPASFTKNARAIGTALLVFFTGASAAATVPDPLSTLMLTWKDDPTTTMTVQWIEDGEAAPLVAAADPYPAITNRVPLVGGSSLEQRPERPFTVTYFADHSHLPPDADNVSAKLHMASNHEALLLWLEVTDDKLVTSEDPRRPWTGDSVEIYLSTGLGSSNQYQVVLTPVFAEGYSPRIMYFDRREDEDAPPVELDARLDITEDGYHIAIALPWKNFGLEAREGLEFAMQLVVTDRDDDDGTQWIGLHPVRGAHNDPFAALPFKLAAKASALLQSRALIQDGEDGSRLLTYGPAEWAGNKLVAQFGGSHREATTLESKGGISAAALDMPAAPDGRRWGEVAVLLEDTLVHHLQIQPWHEHLIPPRPATIRYKVDGGETWQSIEPGLEKLWQWRLGYLHRATLRGLSPDTTYRFEINETGRQFTFHTMPRTLDRPVRIAIGGDTLHEQELMTQMNRKAAAHEPDFVLWGGDLAYADGDPSKLDRWYMWFHALSDGLVAANNRLIPIISTIGNHEVVGGYYFRHDDYRQNDEWRRRIAPYYFQLFPLPGQPGYGALDFGDYLSVLLLDTDHANPIDGEQTAWLEQALRERRHVPNLFPIYHVPAYPSNRPFDGMVSQRVREYWLPLFDDAGIRVAFENHDHTYKRTHPIRGGEFDENGIVFVGDGAWGVRTRPVHPADETWYLARSDSLHHAIIATITADERHFKVIGIDGAIIDAFTIQPRRR